MLTISDRQNKEGRAGWTSCRHLGALPDGVLTVVASMKHLWYTALVVQALILLAEGLFFILEETVSGGVSMKRTYQPHNTRRKRKMGFLVRSKSPSGRRIIRNRRRKGRKRLAV
jgi:large subunit ribosomal protein L34